MLIIFRQRSSSYIVFLLILTVNRRHQTHGAEIRCYCNLPSCVPTGYMCKTAPGQTCFTQRGRHGCTDTCGQDGRVCCHEDMCNYDNTHMEILSNTSNYAPTDGMIRGLREDLWFKAAVIAVPIAGSFILVVLILVATHLLREDYRKYRRRNCVDTYTIDHKLLLPPNWTGHIKPSIARV